MTTNGRFYLLSRLVTMHSNNGYIMLEGSTYGKFLAVVIKCR